MTFFRSIVDDHPALEDSVVLTAARLLLAYIDDNGPIGLTPAKALKRYFVEWAAEAFEWPGYTAEDLYAINRVLNEHDFPPLMVLHEVMLAAKLVRHYKGTLRPTKLAQDLKSHPARLWTLLAHHLLFAIDWSDWSRTGDSLLGNWDIFLNVINVEARLPVARSRLISILYGDLDPRDPFAHTRLGSLFHVQVLRPLCWAGLLEKIEAETGAGKDDCFVKTALWSAALKLDTDAMTIPQPANDRG